MKARHWAWVGAGLGGVAALLAFAPASWLASEVAAASHQHLLLSDARGSIWQGSAVLVLTGGPGSRDAAALPGRLHWRLRPQGLGLSLKARQDCCINGDLELHVKPGWHTLAVRLADRPDASEWQARWPAGWLSGLGTPWNTLQLGGSMRMQTRELSLLWADGTLRQEGELSLDLLGLSSRISTLAPLGNYRFSLRAGALQLSTQEGALQLQGQGLLGAQGASFRGEASAAPGREAALDNLLNIIGQRQGARSIISIG